MTFEFDFERYKRGLSRQTVMTKWLGGDGPYTEEEEEEIKRQFGGKNADLMARQAISLHRKSQTMSSLSGDGELSEDEQQIVDGMGGKNKDFMGKMAVGLKRKSRLVKYLGGDEKEDLSK